MARRMETFLPALLVCGALSATGIFHAWQRVEGIRLSYRLGEVTSEHRTLLRHNEHLRLEVATLKAPSRIERLARDQLGMAPPRPNQVIVVRARPIDSVTPSGPTGAPGNELAVAPGVTSGSPAIVATAGAREGPRG